MGRAPCCDKENVKKGPWSPEEDSRLKQYIEKNGNGGNWIALPHKAGLKRCGKSCRLRWLNYLRPNIKHGAFSDEEDRIICALFSTIGSKWSIMAAQLSGRTDNDIKNHWNTRLKKKLMAMASKSSQRNYPLFVSSSQNSPLPSQPLISSLFKPSDPHCAPSSFEQPISVSFSPFQNLDNLTTSAHYFHSKDKNFLASGSGGSCSSPDGSCTQFSYDGLSEIKQEEMGNVFQLNRMFTLINKGFHENENANQFNQNPNEYIYSGEANPLDQLFSRTNKNNYVSSRESFMIMEDNKEEDLNLICYYLLKSTDD